MIPASGTQYSLRHGSYEAVIASVGASLRVLTYDGRDLVVPFAADEIRPASRGVTLAPWPNRIVDGVYQLHGAEYQVALTEPKRLNAIHGFASWLDFSCVEQSSDRVVLTARIVPQRGYPWSVRLDVTFTLGDSGITQVVRATNESDDAAPFGTAPHPYLVAGPGPLDTWTLELPASKVLEVTPDRLHPVALHDVGSYDPERFDYRVPRVLGVTELDHAYTGLPEGEVEVRVTDPSGTGVRMAWGEDCPWVQIHTADLEPGHGITRLGLAVEPMTCAPDAFNTDRYDYDAGLIMIAPGESTRASWSISAL